MKLDPWETTEINILKHYHGSAKTNADFVKIFEMKIQNMWKDNWTWPSNSRAGRIARYQNLVNKLKGTADNEQQ